MNRERLDLYLRFVEERHRVWELRQLGAPQPWTTDPVLSHHKFTNVFRVLDPGSQFIFELCPPDLGPWDALFRCFLYRYTNEPMTWRWIAHQRGRFPDYDDTPEQVIKDFTSYRDAGNRVFSGAYVILPQPNRPGDKVVQAVELAFRWMDTHSEDFMAATTQKERFDILRREYGVGPFMAMQILTDWGYTPQCGEDREHEFVWPGPGAIKGAKAIAPRYDPRNTIGLMHSMIHLGGDMPIVEGRTPSLMDVQNTLCEFSKYVRFAGKANGFARLYRPLHPGHQPSPILPDHWHN